MSSCRWVYECWIRKWPRVLWVATTRPFSQPFPIFVSPSCLPSRFLALQNRPRPRPKPGQAKPTFWLLAWLVNLQSPSRPKPGQSRSFQAGAGTSLALQLLSEGWHGLIFQLTSISASMALKKSPVRITVESVTIEAHAS